MGNVYGPFGDFGPSTQYSGGNDDGSWWDYFFGPERSGESGVLPGIRGFFPPGVALPLVGGVAGLAVLYTLYSKVYRGSTYLPAANHEPQHTPRASVPQSDCLRETLV
jgi:hypothetical protein